MKFLTLDSFRGLAAILVIFYHSTFYSSYEINTFRLNSYLFVDFFFMLSGFVMAYSYINKISNGYVFKEYLLKRIARLYPLHIFTLLLWVPFILVKIYLYNSGVGASNPTDANNFETFFYHIFLIQAWGVTDFTRSWNGPSWSISTEFFSYIFFFIVIYLAKFVYQFNMFKLIFFVSLFISLFFYFMYLSSYEYLGNFSSLFRCLGGFFSGVIIYFFWKQNYFKNINFWIATSLEILIMAILVYFVSNAHQNLPFLISTYISFSILIYFFSIQNKGVISKLLQNKLFQKLGELSYSIYMVHYIVVISSYNLAAYILKLELFKYEFGGKTHINVITSYAEIINILIFIVVIVISILTYKYIEINGKKLMNQFFNKGQK